LAGASSLENLVLGRIAKARIPSSRCARVAVRPSPSARRRPPVALALAVFAASSSFCAHAATLLRN